MIAEAVAKVTAAVGTDSRLEAETGQGEKELLELLQTAVERYGQAAEAIGQEREKAKTRRPTGTSTTRATDFSSRSRQPYRTAHAGLLSRLRRFASAWRSVRPMFCSKSNSRNANDRHRASRFGPLVPALPEVSLRAVAGRRGQGALCPRLTALVAFMKGVCHASFSTIRKFLRDVAQVDVSRGYLPSWLAKASASLAAPAPGNSLSAAAGRSRAEHRRRGTRNTARSSGRGKRAQHYTLFRIDKSRGSKVLIEVLGTEFDGVLGCDYFGAYRKYMREFDVLVQFCLAHLIRDVVLRRCPAARTKSTGSACAPRCGNCSPWSIDATS